MQTSAPAPAIYTPSLMPLAVTTFYVLYLSDLNWDSIENLNI